MAEIMKEEALAKAITSELNTFSFDYQAFCKAMSMEHRTLQQSFMRLVSEWIRYCADLKDWEIDGRNEASVALCRILKERMDQEGAGRLPFV